GVAAQARAVADLVAAGPGRGGVGPFSGSTAAVSAPIPLPTPDGPPPPGERAETAAAAEPGGPAAEMAGKGVQLLDGSDEERAWAGLVAGDDGQPGETVVRATSRPSDLATVAAALERAAGDAGVGAGLHSQAGLGLHTARLSGGDAVAHAAAVSAWREAVTGLGGTAVVRAHRDGVEERVDLLGPAPSALLTMRAVKAALDGGGRLAPGRFGSWW
ncbi:MAG: hypothetical protein ACRD0J_02290, partial [Acidimicrobiales bacterium]